MREKKKIMIFVLYNSLFLPIITIFSADSILHQSSNYSDNTVNALLVKDPIVNHGHLSIKSNDHQTENADALTGKDVVPIMGNQDENSIEDIPLTGIDTTTLKDPQGNWLFKRIWWERAQEIYEKVRLFVSQIMDYRMQFFMQRAEVDRLVLDPFYSHVGVAQGQLQEIIEIVLTHLQDERMATTILDLQERNLGTEAANTKDILEAFKIDVQMIAKLDKIIDQALEQLVQECNKVRGYEQEAWTSYKQIGQELSDKKARELFYHLDVHMRYIKDIQRYLQNDFTQYFQDLIQQISSEASRLMGVIDKLKERGIDFKKQFLKPVENSVPVKSEDFLDEHNEHTDEKAVETNNGLWSRLKSRFNQGIEEIKSTIHLTVTFVKKLFHFGKDPETETTD